MSTTSPREYEHATDVRTYTHPNFNPPKEEWGEGPWQEEPDKMQWVDTTTGLACLAVRNRMGAWCGYVGVPPTHPDFEKDYTDVPYEAHGSLTYSDSCQELVEGGGVVDAEAQLICHVPAPGEPDHVWWFGFDCLHYMDYAPGMEATTRKIDRELGERGEPRLETFNTAAYIMRTTYKTLGYVMRECHHLALQLAAGAKKGDDQ